MLIYRTLLCYVAEKQYLCIEIKTKSFSDMNANILQDFRVMQLAVVGANFMRYSRNTTDLLLEGIDRINIGDNIEITEISLHHDSVLVSIAGVNSIMPLKNLSYDVAVEIITILKAKALGITNRDVIVNGKDKVIE